MRAGGISAETLYSHLFSGEEGWLVAFSGERHGDPRRLDVLRMVEKEEREGIRALLGGAA